MPSLTNCFAGNFIGTDFDINQGLSRKLPEEWRAFNKEFISVYLAAYPDKSKITAGLACGALWTVSKGIKRGDIESSRRVESRRQEALPPSETSSGAGKYP